ncbi:hypothetical protein C1O66_10710 [Paucibacter aquatile]|uniref:Uncharacterized protein n=1 Tax=Kinneretia aquatilis TaxID=2070761 RepID=A0A2N8KWZ5_9BURK|nr:hypothetical protein [Paucibacter aquatile]PND37951.1 hypothetical protein C1O66_10710 [Paucibacter aquatile]
MDSNAMTDCSMSSGSRWYAQDLPAKDSLQIAAQVYGVIPTGWLALWRKTMRQLVNARTPDREFSLMYLSVDWDNGLLELDMPWADEVLTGIARRCARRSCFICRQCGKPGLLRRFDMSDVAVLCARCAAPELLHRAIDDTVKYPGLIAIGGSADDARRVPDVLRKAFVRAARRDDATGPAMDAAGFRQWVAQLQRVQSVLPPRSA